MGMLEAERDHVVSVLLRKLIIDAETGVPVISVKKRSRYHATTGREWAIDASRIFYEA
jgi:hypothetical protein